MSFSYYIELYLDLVLRFPPQLKQLLLQTFHLRPAQIFRAAPRSLHFGSELGVLFLEATKLLLRKNQVRAMQM